MTGRSVSEASFPLRVLHSRLGQSSFKNCLWASYLPEELRQGRSKLVNTTLESKHSPVSSKDDSQFGVASGTPVHQLRSVSVKGKVWQLSQDSNGCRDVQHALSMASEQEVFEITLELQGHIWEAARGMHSNHVLQKCIELLNAESLQFVVDELVKGKLPIQAARHKYACRIVQRLLERCTSDQVAPIISSIMNELLHVACHPYGNYVIQHLIKHSSREQRHTICELMLRDLPHFGFDMYGSAVLSNATAFFAQSDNVAIALRLLEDPGLMYFLAKSRHGYPTALMMLKVLDGRDRKSVEHIFAQDPSLLASRYGRIVAASVGLIHLAVEDDSV
eukprot:TRINITY_DN3158_c0_g2_i2.p1 TRINITY_DN3158_c0_g2~~TRINITY_DN3158_c0_g2_i2.p1  ORF type:complete len:334 (-),score=77.03 TRINITY_DN3158_c0_g2_i2:120-1121(-)